MKFDPKLDLMIEMILDITPEQAWNGWTDATSYGEWFCPKPWTVSEARIELRPGGEFYTKMKGPEAGQEFAGSGCILEVIPNKKLVWTSALLPDFRPAVADVHGFFFTAEVHFENVNGKTKYTAIARHPDEASMIKHRDMGFTEGWKIVANQLEEMMRKK